MKTFEASQLISKCKGHKMIMLTPDGQDLIKESFFSLEYEFCASKMPPMNDTIVITPDGIFKEIVVFLEYELCATQCNVIGYEQS